MKQRYRWLAYYRLTQRIDWKLALTIAGGVALVFLVYALGRAWLNWRWDLWVLGSGFALMVGAIAHAVFGHLGFPQRSFTFRVGLLRGGVLDVHLTPRRHADVRQLASETEQTVRALEPLLHIGVFDCIRIQSPLLARGKGRSERLQAQLVAALPLRAIPGHGTLGAVKGFIYAWKRGRGQGFVNRARSAWHQRRRQITKGFDLRRE